MLRRRIEVKVGVCIVEDTIALDRQGRGFQQSQRLLHGSTVIATTERWYEFVEGSVKERVSISKYVFNPDRSRNGVVAD